MSKSGSEYTLVDLLNERLNDEDCTYKRRAREWACCESDTPCYSSSPKRSRCSPVVSDSTWSRYDQYQHVLRESVGKHSKAIPLCVVEDKKSPTPFCAESPLCVREERKLIPMCVKEDRIDPLLPPKRRSIPCRVAWADLEGCCSSPQEVNLKRRDKHHYYSKNRRGYRSCSRRNKQNNYRKITCRSNNHCIFSPESEDTFTCNFSREADMSGLDTPREDFLY